MLSLQILCGLLIALVAVHGQQRIRVNVAPGDDDTLQVFGTGRDVTPSGLDSDTFSVTDRIRGSGSNSRRSGGRVGSSGGRFSGSASSGNREGSDSGDSLVDTGFDRLTTDRSDSRGSGSGSDRDNTNDDSLVGGASGSLRRTTSSSDRDWELLGSGSDSSSGSRSGSDRSRRSTTMSSRDRDTDSLTGDRDSDLIASAGNSAGRVSQFPDNYRIEVQVLSLENKLGITAAGANCDFLSACDTKLYAIIETDRAQSPWNSTSAAKGKWPVIFSVTNNNSPAINKVVARDVCGAPSYSQVSLRVYAVDEDSVSAEDEINRFQCDFTLTPAGIASAQPSAQYGDAVECKPSSQPTKMKLLVKQRAYAISSSACNSQRLQ